MLHICQLFAQDLQISCHTTYTVTYIFLHLGQCMTLSQSKVRCQHPGLSSYA